MFLLQATMAPVIAEITGKRKLLIPKMSLQDVVAWAAVLKDEEIEEMTKGLEAAQKREYLTVYPPTSPDFNYMRRMSHTPEGVRYILNFSLPKASVQNEDGSPAQALTEAEISGIVAGSPYQLEILATMIVDLMDTSTIMKKTTTTASASPPENEPPPDPSKRQGK